MDQGIRASVILAALSIAGAFAAFTAWPGGEVPVHFNFEGTADRYASPLVGFFLFPVINAFVLVIVWLAMRTEPGRENLKRSGRVFGVTLAGAMMIMVIAQAAVVAKIFGEDVAIEKIVPSAVGLLLCVTGNYLPKIKPNWTIGIRNRWTLSDEETWRRTHRFSGPVLVAGGLALMVIPWLVDARVMRASIFAVIAGIVIVPTAYSYVVWAKSKRTD